MIRVELQNEQRPVTPRRVFDLRRHKQQEQPSNSEKIYLTVRATDGNGGVLADEEYPVVIDGRTGIVKIRKRVFETMGFTVVMEDK